MSLRLRLFILTVVLFACALLVAGFAIPSLVRGFLVERVDEKLVGVGIAAIGELRASPEFEDTNAQPGELGLGLEGGYFEIREAGGGVVASGFLGDDAGGRQAPDIPDGSAASSPNTAITVGGTGDGTETSYRVAVVEPPGLAIGPETSLMEDVTIVAALPLTEVDDVLARIVFVEVAVGVVVLGLFATGSWWVVGIGLRPLRRMEETVESIRADGFTSDSVRSDDPHGGSGDGRRRQRVDHPANRTEIGRLGATLNGMLDEIDDAFERQLASESKLRRFVTDASHELRTPLTSIRGYAQLLSRLGIAPDPQQVANSLERIEHESVRMTALLEDMLTIARFDEEPPLRLERVDVAALVRHLAADARAAEPGRRIDTTAPDVLVVGADAARLAQAALNLVTNARVHTDRDRPIEIRAHRDDKGASVVISVVDHGAGIPDGQRQRVFDRFARLDEGRSRARGGSGLGLAIVASIAHAHGGTITATDTPGGGATFTLVIPDRTPASTDES